MATYKEIQNWVREHYGWTPKTCWIAHCKELYGLERRDAPNRHGNARKHPCPSRKQNSIGRAFRYFKML